MSPIAWQNIKFYGCYDFGTENTIVDLVDIVNDRVRKNQQKTPVRVRRLLGWRFINAPFRGDMSL